MRNPAHPGGFVQTEIIEPLGLSVTEAARVLGVTRAALSALLNQQASLSPEMAIRIGESLRHFHGNAHAHAEQLRHCPSQREKDIAVSRYLPASVDRRPRTLNQPALPPKGEPVPPVRRRLVEPAADRNARQTAQQQRPNATMGDDRDIARR
jgi:addiction module HigA family antidote